MAKTIIFDWDGTLHNTKKLYGSAFRAAYQWLVDQGLAPERELSDDYMATYLGYPAPKMWDIFMPDLAKEYANACSLRVGENMAAKIMNGEAILYDGALDVLKELKKQGHRLVFLSACRISYFNAHREYFHLDEYFDTMYAGETFDFRPKTEIFELIKDENPGEYVVIGDRKSDIDIGTVHGLTAIGCSYGFGTPDELAAADYIIDDIRELPDLISKL